MKLMQGDCFELINDIPDKSVDLILTDIPFEISRENNFKTMKDRTGRNGIEFGEWDKGFDVASLKLLVPKLNSNGSFITFCAFEQYSKLLGTFENELVVKDRMIWQKTNPMPRNRDRRYINNIELCVWFTRKDAKWIFNRQSEKYDSCVMTYPSESGGGYKRYHPCQKNEKLLEKLILRHTNKGDTVFDPFMGSGSTGVACVNTNRDFIGMELNGEYFQIAENRIRQAEEDLKTQKIQQKSAV